MRGLDEDARAVAGIGFTTASATMIEVEQNAERLADDVVGFLTFDIDEETDAASFMFELRIVEALFTGRPDAGSCGRGHRPGANLFHNPYVCASVQFSRLKT